MSHTPEEFSDWEAYRSSFFGLERIPRWRYWLFRLRHPFAMREDRKA